MRDGICEDENGIVMADARSLSSKASEGGSKQIGRILNREISRQTKRGRRPAESFVYRHWAQVRIPALKVT
jgi:hypothetical protein